MIKANVSGERVSLATHGTMKDILCDSALIIKAVYTTFCRKNPDVGEAYKSMMQGVVSDPESPIWQVNEQDGDVMVDMAELKRQMEEGQ